METLFQRETDHLELGTLWLGLRSLLWHGQEAPTTAPETPVVEALKKPAQDWICGAEVCPVSGTGSSRSSTSCRQPTFWALSLSLSRSLSLSLSLSLFDALCSSCASQEGEFIIVLVRALAIGCSCALQFLIFGSGFEHDGCGGRLRLSVVPRTKPMGSVWAWTWITRT